jgi:hypothetical protein
MGLFWKLGTDGSISVPFALTIFGVGRRQRAFSLLLIVVREVGGMGGTGGESSVTSVRCFPRWPVSRMEAAASALPIEATDRRLAL